MFSVCLERFRNVLSTKHKWLWRRLPSKNKQDTCNYQIIRWQTLEKLGFATYFFCTLRHAFCVGLYEKVFITVR